MTAHCHAAGCPEPATGCYTTDSGRACWRFCDAHGGQRAALEVGLAWLGGDGGIPPQPYEDVHGALAPFHADAALSAGFFGEMDQDRFKPCARCGATGWLPTSISPLCGPCQGVA